MAAAGLLEAIHRRLELGLLRPWWRKTGERQERATVLCPGVAQLVGDVRQFLFRHAGQRGGPLPVAGRVVGQGEMQVRPPLPARVAVRQVQAECRAQLVECLRMVPEQHLVPAEFGLGPGLALTVAQLHEHVPGDLQALLCLLQVAAHHPQPPVVVDGPGLAPCVAPDLVGFHGAAQQPFGSL